MLDKQTVIKPKGENMTQEILDLIKEFGLIDITTDRQKANGTTILRDEQTSCSYGIYTSGYVRRKVDDHYDDIPSTHYQLNLTKSEKKTIYFGDNQNRSYTYTQKERILIHNHTLQIELLKRRIPSFRKYVIRNYK